MPPSDANFISIETLNSRNGVLNADVLDLYLEHRDSSCPAQVIAALPSACHGGSAVTAGTHRWNAARGGARVPWG